MTAFRKSKRKIALLLLMVVLLISISSVSASAVVANFYLYADQTDAHYYLSGYTQGRALRLYNHTNSKDGVNFSYKYQDPGSSNWISIAQWFAEPGEQENTFTPWTLKVSSKTTFKGHMSSFWWLGTGIYAGGKIEAK